MNRYHFGPGFLHHIVPDQPAPVGGAAGSRSDDIGIRDDCHGGDKRRSRDANGKEDRCP